MLDHPDAFGDLSQSGQVGLDAGVRTPHVVEVFGVAQLPGEMQLVQARPAAEGELVSEQLVLGDLDDQPREDQVLLDLDLLGPRRLGCPLVQVGLRDHRSGSTATFMRTPQVESARPRRGPDGLSSAGSPRSSLAARRSGPRSRQEP